MFALRGDIEVVRLAEMFSLFVESLVALSTTPVDVLRPGDDTVRDVTVADFVVPAVAVTGVRGFGATDVALTVGREIGALNIEEKRFTHENRIIED